MSEYWVSHKKYFCKYCDIYISDDAPSRSQHENGMRHKGNKERFVKGLYKAGEKRKKDAEEEKREMARVEQAAQAAFALDLGAGHAKASSSSAPAAAAPKPPPPKPSNPYANYSTAESLGYVDPDLEKLKAEAERRRTMGVAGDWEVVSTPSISQPENPETGAPSADVVDGDGSRKREAEGPVDDDDDRQFKLRKKTWGAGLGEIYDPGVIPVKLKSKREPMEIGEAGGKPAPSDNGPQATGVPKWTKVAWKKAGDNSMPNEETSGKALKTEVEPGPSVSASGGDPNTAERESAGTAFVGEAEKSNLQSLPNPIMREEATVKIDDAVSEPSEAVGGSLFRKRKAAGGAGSRGRRQY